MEEAHWKVDERRNNGYSEASDLPHGEGEKLEDSERELG